MRFFRYTAALVLLLLSLIACSDTQEQIETTPEPKLNLTEFDPILPDYLFDQGSWFGMKNLEKGLGFSPTLILSDSMGYLLPDDLFTLEFDGKVETKMVPGMLYQKGAEYNYNIIMETVFTDHQTALIRYTVENLLGQDRQMRLMFKAGGKEADNGFEYQLSNSTLKLTFDTPYRLFGDKLEYPYEFPVFTMSANSSITRYVFVKHLVDGEKELEKVDFTRAEDLFEAHQNRWRDYLKPYKNLSEKKQLLAAKCIQTLVNNWRSPSGELKHAGVFPSYHQGYFNGFWAWDSWKHAVALANIEPEVAKDQIRAMFDFQDEHGMIADAVFRDTLFERHNWRNTKPPLAGWAVYEIYQQTLDTAFVEELMPRLEKYHEWWYEHRDHNDNYLCEYGSTDGTRIAAAWESGMDNAVRFDGAKMLKNSDVAWSLDQESVDLNAYLYAEKGFLAELAHVCLDNYKSLQYKNTRKYMLDDIQDRFFDEETGYFYDYNYERNEQVKVLGPEAWITLWAKVAKHSQAETVIDIISDTSHFNTFCPFPTLDASHPDFNPQNGYWRGPVWLDQAYFALQGMRNYGHFSYDSIADVMTEKLLNNAEGILEQNESIRENYHPITGQGLNVHHFSWSAAHLLLLLKDEVNREKEDSQYE